MMHQGRIGGFTGIGIHSDLSSLGDHAMNFDASKATHFGPSLDREKFLVDTPRSSDCTGFGWSVSLRLNLAKKE